MHISKKLLARFPCLLLGGVALLWGCAPGGGEGAPDEEPARTVLLGPADGHDLPPTELTRVAVGSPAPDFSLETLSGDTVTLSSFRGRQNVILVFYRGHW